MNDSKNIPEGARNKVGSKRILKDILSTRSKIFSILIVMAVAIPIIAVAAQTSITGRTLPDSIDFRMRNVDNQEWKYLSDYRGNVVLLDFMATWCATCIEAMPDLLQIHQQYSSEPFVLLSVTASISDNISLMQQFKATYSANWTFAVPFNIAQISYDYGVSAYPTQVIVDKEGRITYKSVGHVPIASLKSEIDKALSL